MSGPTAVPVLWLAVDPKTGADRENLQTGLQQLMREDPTFRARTDPQTGQTVIGALGELHLEIIVDRLFREFNVGARIGRPQVSYKETFTQAAEGNGRYVQQPDGRGQYGHARIRVFPGEAGSGYVFENAIVGGAIPGEFINPIDEGIQEACTRGVLAGYPIDDVRIELYDGSYHDGDSTEVAFRIAGSMAFLDAAKNGRLVLLEPVMRVEVFVPLEHTAEVMGDLAARRGVIQSLEDSGGTQIIQALVPMAEMFGYAMDLRSRTGGRATFSLHFDRYEQVRIDPNFNDDDRNPLVGTPLKPVPRPKDSGVALPEPDDE